MRRALEEDQYSANGSIVDTDSDDDELQYIYKGQSIRLDRSYLVQAARKHLWLERYGSKAASSSPSAPTTKDTSSRGSSSDAEDSEGRRSRSASKKKKKGKRGKDDERSTSPKPMDAGVGGSSNIASAPANDYERDEGSIFGQTTGSSNSTWVECDKCKKVRSDDESCNQNHVWSLCSPFFVCNFFSGVVFVVS